MSALQKFAWFNLVVIGATLAATAATYPIFGKPGLGCLGLTGLMGLGCLFFWKHPNKVVVDERDRLFQVRSLLFAYSGFWLVFVLAFALLLPLVYGQDGAVPVQVLQLGVFLAMMIVYALLSAGILFQYAGGGKHGG